MRVFFSLTLIGLFFISSCAFFNEKTADLRIVSSPSGSDIVIDNKFYGRTPAVIKIRPENYEIHLIKSGYGRTSFRTDFWVGAIRTDVNEKITADGTRCLLDMLSIVFFFNAFTEQCSDFKQKTYSVQIEPNQQYRPW